AEDAQGSLSNFIFTSEVNSTTLYYSNDCFGSYINADMFDNNNDFSDFDD
ncbi:2681_t:CDS:2, partial [Scutellospora calospora]